MRNKFLETHSLVNVLLLVSVCICVFFIFSHQVFAETITAEIIHNLDDSNSMDAKVRAFEPDEPEDADDIVNSGGWGGFSAQSNAHIWFDESGLPATSSEIVSVSLNLFFADPETWNRGDVRFGRAASYWDEGVTWNTRPDQLDAFDIVDLPPVSGWYAVDITEYYKNWLDGVYPNYGFRIIPLSTDKQSNAFYSTENSNSELRPYVKIVTETEMHLNTAPVFELLSNKQLNEGEVLEFVVSAQDPDGDEVLLSVDGLPTGAGFNSDTGVFSWATDYADSGEYEVTFTATDDTEPAASSSETVTITVQDVPTLTEKIGALIEVVNSPDVPFLGRILMLAHLQNVERSVEKEKYKQAKKQMQQFIGGVNLAYRLGRISETVRDDLLARANDILDDLNEFLE